MPAVDADPRFGSFGLRTDCPRCGENLPINGPAESIDCSACGHRVGVPAALLAGLFEDFEKGWPKPTGSGTILRGDLTWRWTAEAMDAPTCQDCQEPLPDITSPGESVCGGCGVVTPSIVIPDRLHKRFPAATLAIGAFADLTRADEPPKPVVLQCPQCGAGLTISADRSRISTCEYCTSQVHLPDAVWRALHPPREVRPWTVRFEGEGPAAVLARQRQERADRKREQAENKRKKAEKNAEVRRRADEAKAKRAKMDAEAEEKRKRFRSLTGLVGVGVAMIAVLAACAVMGVAVIAYISPRTFQVLGIEPGALLTGSLLGVGAASFVVAWAVAVVAAAWRGDVPILSTLMFSVVNVMMVLVPFVGPLAALWLTFDHLRGRQPTPAGMKHPHRHPLGTAWPLAVLYPVGALFFTVALAISLDMTLWELFQRFGED